MFSPPLKKSIVFLKYALKMDLVKGAWFDLYVYFTLHRKYYLKLRQALVTDFSKQGLDLYGAH